MAVQVVTVSAGGPPLTGIAKVFAGSLTSCAVDGTGNLWCWGYGGFGQIGNGFTNNAAVATPVLTQAGGAQFGGVDTVSISNTHACARKVDGTVWCWGGNNYGQIGVGSAQSSFLFPTQVTALFNSALDLSTNATSTSCSTTNDGSVWCWGNNPYGALGNGTNVSSNVPVQVLAAAGGAPFAGAIKVVALNGAFALLKGADHSIWWWGDNKLTPVPFTESSVPVAGVRSLTGGNGQPGFIGFDGTVHLTGGAATTAIACP
jgi:alpha-tubulin suppressor-like RCC1 family protein